MILGIDFDNTIVCYDTVFHEEACRQGLIPFDIPVAKNAIRDYLRASGREADWTRLQGHVYGACMPCAKAFPGAIEFFEHCRSEQIPTFIISHKTRRPYDGEGYDLHRSAMEWLTLNGFFDRERIGLAPDRIFWELTRHEKLARIDSTGCTHFIDDLPEVLGEPSFPERVERILFDPNELRPDDGRFTRLTSWNDITQWLHS